MAIGARYKSTRNQGWWVIRSEPHLFDGEGNMASEKCPVKALGQWHLSRRCALLSMDAKKNLSPLLVFLLKLAAKTKNAQQPVQGIFAGSVEFQP